MFEDAPEGIEPNSCATASRRLEFAFTSVLELRDDPRVSEVERGNHHVVSGGRVPLTLA